MDERSKETLDAILDKEPEQLRKDEVAFLKARREYLKSPQLKKFDSILNPKPPKKETVSKKNAKNTK